jgi:CheY-like chemotaxis protein
MTLGISLPDVSGIEVLKQIRRRGWDLSAVVLIGNPYEGLRAKCQQLGLGSLGQVKRVGTGSTGAAGGRDPIRKCLRNNSSL